MGSNNCKERVDVGPHIDAVFELNYMLFALHTIEFVFRDWWPITFGVEIGTITVDMFLSINMLQLGGAVQCAIDNNIYGPDTKSRFVDFSAEYIDWAFIFTLYFVFADTIFLNIVGAVIEFITFFGLGLFSGWVSELIMSFKPLIRWCLLIVNLYMANSVYEGFHPTLAPDLSDKYTTDMPSLFDLFWK